MWFVLGPAAVAMASSALFALDAVARYRRLSERSLALALVGAVGVANVAGGWGHPEDCVAVAFVVWAALTMERLGARGRGGSWGIGSSSSRWPSSASRGSSHGLVGGEPRARAAAGAPELGRSALPLLAETHRTLFVLVRQPFEPKYISFTPLTHWAPVIGPGIDGGGPTRLVAIAVSAGLAVVVCHRRHGLSTVLGLLRGRVLPPNPARDGDELVLPLARSRPLPPARASAGTPALWLCTGALVTSMVLGDRRVHDIALWWPAVMATAALMLLCAAPPLGRWFVPSGRWRHASDATVGPVEFPSMVEPVTTGQHGE